MAASAHIPGKEVAKSVMVRLDGTLAMAVLPASYRVDFARIVQPTVVNVATTGGS
jgi:Ala-tRNA(Pro) deacylase